MFCKLRLNKKVKAVPVTAWSGPESYRNLRFPDFMTTAQYGGKIFSLTHTPPLTPGIIPGSHLDMRKLSAKWVPKCMNADQKHQRCQSSEQI